MNENKPTVRLEMGKPATYRIRLVGRLNPRWASHLENMNIMETMGENGGPQTILVGRLADQAALSGILNTLYDYHMPVLSVECLDYT